MNRILVNIRSCNGTGKSTIPMSMMDDPKMFVQELYYSDGKKMGALTVFPSYGWVALGTYFNKTGGLDSLKNNEVTRRTLYAALDLFPEYDVLMEGIIASTIRQPYIDLFHVIENTYDNVQVMVFSFLPPVEIALRRVYKRNSGNSINEKKVKSHWVLVERAHYVFKTEGFTALRIDTSKVPKDLMLPCFLKSVEKYRRE